MEIRPVIGEGGTTEGFVVDVLGQVEYRDQRHEACEAALAILEREVDKLRVAMAHLAGSGDEPESGEDAERAGDSGEARPGRPDV